MRVTAKIITVGESRQAHTPSLPPLGKSEARGGERCYVWMPVYILLFWGS